MKVLDLFAGLRGWSDPWAERGHETFTVDLDPRFEVSLHADVLTLIPADLPWRPDVILASPPCEAFSVMTISRNWHGPRMPKSPKAELAIRLVEATIRLIAETRPTFWVIENPRAMARKLSVLAKFDRRTVTYCRYGEPWQKPTDLWGGFPSSLTLKPMCRPGASCHASAPRGSQNGIQGRGLTRSYNSKDPRRAELTALVSKIPRALSLAICEAAECDLATGYVPATLWESGLLEAAS